MKKALIIVMAALLLTGCGSRAGGEAGAKGTETGTGTAVTEGSAMGVNTTAVTDSNQSAATVATDGDFTTKGYLMQDAQGMATYYLEVTNNSDKTVRVDIDGKGTCRDGNTGDRFNTSIEVLGPGETSAAVLYFTSPTTFNIVNASCELTADTNVTCKPIISELSITPYYNRDNVTVEVKNNSSEFAQRLQLLAIFLDENDKLLGTSMSYVSHEGFLAPGETNAVQLNVCPEAKGYDHVDIVPIGVCGDTEHPVPEKVDVGEKGLDIQEFHFSNENGSRCCLAITNDSDKTVAVTGNGSAKDAEGNLLGASSFTTIDVLAPGETAYADLFFDGVFGAASVDYTTGCYVPEANYKPIIGDLVPYVSANDGALTIELSNVGKTVGESVWVHVLYFDKNDKMIGIDYAFFDDADYELKAGKTIIQVLDTYRDYDHFKLFLSGKGKA